MLAEWYGTTSPAVIRCGWGQERNRNGGGATMAILALPAVAGKFGVRGGGYTMSNSGAYGIQAESLIDVPVPSARLVNMNLLGRTLLEATSARGRALCLQLQPARHRARSEPRAAGTSCARTCSPSSTTRS